MRLLKIILKWTVLLIVLAVTLVALVAAVISHQGRARLAEVKAELIAKGEKLTLSELLPTPIPDHLNLFEDPIWRPVEPTIETKSNRLKQTPLALANTPLTEAELAQGRALFGGGVFSHPPPLDRLDIARKVLVESYPQPLGKEQARWILEILTPFDPLLKRIVLLLDRPFARFRESTDFLNSEVYEFGGGLSYVAGVLKPRASARIALGDSEEVLSDVNTLSRLISPTAAEPVLYMEMLRLYLATCIDELIREGITKRIWSDGHLAGIEAMLQPVDLTRGIANAFRAERGFQNQYLEELYLGQRRVESEHLPSIFRERHFGMELWPFYLHVFGPADQANLNRDIQSLVELLDNSKRLGIDEVAIGKLIAPNNTGFLRDTFFYLLGGNVSVAIELQTSLDQARIACALERYRLRHGSYPSELALLVPEFLPNLPPDRYSLEPMKYTLLGNDRFELAARSGEQRILWANFHNE